MRSNGVRSGWPLYRCDEHATEESARWNGFNRNGAGAKYEAHREALSIAIFDDTDDNGGKAA